MKYFRFARTIVFGSLLVASLTLNVATVAISSVSVAVSTAYETVMAAASVLGQKNRELDAKTKQLQKNTKQLDAATSQLDAKNKQVASLSDEIEVKTKQLQKNTKQLDAATSQLDAKNKLVVSLSDEVAALRKSKTVTYRGQQRLLSEAVEDTAGRLSRRTATGAARNAGSVIAESIPFAGIAVIIGVTAWDLKDACATMGDLHELELAFNPDAATDPEASEVCGLKVPTKEEVWRAVKASPGQAWTAAKALVPDLPEFKKPKIDWRFWD